MNDIAGPGNGGTTQGVLKSRAFTRNEGARDDYDRTIMTTGLDLAVIGNCTVAFGKPGSTFLVCTFWYIEALGSVGRREEALALFENILTHRNHLGLLPQDIAPDTGTLRGNFPQTYSQVGLISAAMRLSRSWEEGMWHAS
jgi:hypothetical protein